MDSRGRAYPRKGRGKSTSFHQWLQKNSSSHSQRRHQGLYDHGWVVHREFYGSVQGWRALRTPQRLPSSRERRTVDRGSDGAARLLKVLVIRGLKYVPIICSISSALRRYTMAAAIWSSPSLSHDTIPRHTKGMEVGRGVSDKKADEVVARSNLLSIAENYVLSVFYFIYHFPNLSSECSFIVSRPRLVSNSASRRIRGGRAHVRVGVRESL